ncbi:MULTISPECIES: response regulator transcription factor [unclassified Pseudomonas]|uniref:response regulator transcription factor n=1 Tax=unclassified Pseudomonas TaxID=196821 RepID=UPI00244CD180|nr:MULTISPECIES: response regulator transcription factor [unclassified Pseudomonas]MDG9924988.1 response regulator transcription factor [Pseudomonas sp. GD04045]MDH0036269.1 response regulator transcription factor [Pseudomonas sp. GD04019]
MSATSARILAIEDDPVLAAHLQEHLGRRGFDVTLQGDGEAGLALACSETFDLVLLDILLPGCNGLEALAELRRRRRVPVILMSALGAEQDRIAGFSQGADDYLPKPFAMAEMEVRIEAILRRVAYERRDREPVASAPQLELDEVRLDARHAGQWAQLTGTEFRLLEIFVRHSGEVLSKAFLYQQVLHRPWSQHDRGLDMHVSHIRRKLQAIGYLAGRVETAWGKGYLFQREEG